MNDLFNPMIGWFSIAFIVYLWVFVRGRALREDASAEIMYIKNRLSADAAQKNIDLSDPDLVTAESGLEGLAYLVRHMGPASVLVSVYYYYKSPVKRMTAKMECSEELGALIHARCEQGLKFFVHYMFFTGFMGLAVKVFMSLLAIFTRNKKASVVADTTVLMVRDITCASYVVPVAHKKRPTMQLAHA
jgi:hypothetical protein